MKENAFIRAQKFDINNVISSYEAIYKSLTWFFILDYIFF
jgi:hypothetical protein